MKRILQLLLIVLLPFGAMAQVTNGTITGTVKNAEGKGVEGAAIIATFEPTGLKFTVLSKANGRFTIDNVPPGGPYTFVVNYVGFAEFKKTDISVPLGEKYEVSVTLTQSTKQLDNVVVTSTKKSGVEKTGAATSISQRQIQSLPNISRSLTAVTRLNPQSNGNSFAGMNSRYNSITIDGSIFNNNFGRSGDGFVPGGAIGAISIDAIDQVQVNVAPFDVRQSGFIGGGVNAVTKRGTNKWYGTAYTFYRNQDFNGRKVKDVTVANAKRSTKIFGGSVGGPIIKNKLFFFVNAEREERMSPGQTWLAKRPGVNDGNPNVTPVLATDLDRLSSFLASEYKVNVGGYEGYDFATTNTKFIARVDWNINTKNRLTLRYTQSETNDDDQINTSSVTGLNALRINNGRRGGLVGGLAYESSNFVNNTTVKSTVLELNSTLFKNVTNQLIASYTDNQPKRVPNINIPFVDIMRDPNNVYISFGTDLFSYQNFIEDKSYNFSNNVNITLGAHSITAGASFEYMTFANSFMSAGGPSYYRYNSLQDFLDKKSPSVFGVTYDPANPKGVNVPRAKFAQLGVYLQDVFNVNDRFKLTYGLRIDQPFYPYTPPRNPALEAVVFRDENGNPEKFDVSKWPDSKPLFSPRIGFNYDVMGDKSIIVRGGTGVFTGRIPFIWLVNQVGDNGVVRALYQASTAELANIRYSTDRNTYIPTNPPAVGTSIPSGSSFSGVAKDFKMPQTFRSNIAIDKKLGKDYVATFEALYTKMINNVYFRNANLGTENGTLMGAIDKRPYYNTRLNSNINQMSVMDNTNKGFSAAFTLMLAKNFSNNWEASIAYTHTLGQDVAIGTSDQSGSSWTTNNIINNPNRPELGASNFAIPHRLVGSFSYKFDYLNKKFATTIGLFYSGASQDRFSYRYGGDINNDGATNDMIYIPKDASEIQFVEGLRVGSNVYSAKAQSDAFFRFIENDKYLKNKKGQYIERYGATLPFVHNLDLRILQDFNFKVGSRTQTIQVNVDFVNFLNLLNSNWGFRYSYTYGTFQDQGLLGLPTSGSSSNNTGNEAFNRLNPKYTFNPEGATRGYQPNFSTSSTWGLQLGIRYIF